MNTNTVAPISTPDQLAKRLPATLLKRHISAAAALMACRIRL